MAPSSGRWRQRVLVLGGTRFIGRAIVEELVDHGHDVTVVHRGVCEPADLPDIQHLHIPRAEWATHSEILRQPQPDAVIDCMALTRKDARFALDAVPDAHLVVLSSQDVYRAFAALQHGLDVGAVTELLNEASPLRNDRFPHRGEADEYELYSKMDVEEEYAARQATILRLPATYGEHDNQRREEFILRRARARRPRIPIGAGELLWTRGYVRDIARGVVQAATDATTAGEILNLGELRSWSMKQWAERILEAAGSPAHLTTVDDDSLPSDMRLTAGALTQRVLVSTAKARAWFGYEDTDAMTALRASVEWHLAHPPDDADLDFAADESALASLL